ncbi:MAG: CmcJ/NvfI family oxidoreductase, partial [Casimicrobiaceae bacterium]
MRYEPTGQLPAVTGQLGYIASGVQRAEVRIFPPASGIPTERPKSVPHAMPIHDARPIADSLRLDEQGFEFHARPSEVTDFYDDATVREHYYPEVRNVVRELMNAEDVFVFDHNVRSAVRAARGELGVRVPVDQVHNDYTLESGPKRKLEILAAAGRSDLSDAQVAFVNLWRPILGPVR